MTTDSPWDLGMCVDVAREIAVRHALDVEAYIEGAAAGSRVRIDLKRGSMVLGWVAIPTEQLERCGDKSAVRELVGKALVGVGYQPAQRAKRIVVPPHDDNTGAACRSVYRGETIEGLVKHDCCHLCNELGKEGCNCEAIYEAMGRFEGDTEHGHHIDCIAQNVLQVEIGKSK